MLKFLSKIISVCFVVVCFISCSDRYKTVQEQFVEVNRSDLKDDTLIKDSGSAFYFSRLSKPNSFGRLYVYKYPEDQIGKEHYVVFSGKTRTNYAESNSTISLAVHDKKGEQLCWKSIFLRRHFTDINKWVYFKDSIRIDPKYIGKKSATVSCMLYLARSTNENFDFDTLHVTVKEKE
ncbi:MAG: hypothetical protein V4635_10970 [Bacteroidota bacterium]